VGKLNVKAAAQLAGVSEHTLRAWERRYQAVSPGRSGTGRRFYSLEEVERVRMLQRLVDRGHSISSVANLSDPQLADLLLKQVEESHHASHRAAAEENLPAPSAQVSENIDRLIQAIHEFKMELMDAELTRARSLFSSRQLILEVITRVMPEVGRRVAGGHWSIAQEHAFSAILRDHLGQALRSLLAPQGNDFPTGNKDGHSVLFATPEGDLHEFGILMSAILASSRRGINVKYIGPNLPASDLVLAARRLEARVILLGATDSPDAFRKLTLQSYLEQIDRKLEPGVEIWVGGTETARIKDFRSSHKLVPIHSLTDLDKLLQELANSSG